MGVGISAPAQGARSHSPTSPDERKNKLYFLSPPLQGVGRIGGGSLLGLRQKSIWQYHIEVIRDTVVLMLTTFGMAD